MSISGTTTDYTDRQLDLELLQSIAIPAGSQAVSVSTALKPPKVVAGVEKVVQRYTLLFLTTVGDMIYDREQGTNFISAVMRGNIHDRAGLQTYFAASNDAVLAQMASDDAKTDVYGAMPLDEQIDSAQLLDFDIDFGTATVKLSVEITTKAGTSIEFVVPATTIG